MRHVCSTNAFSLPQNPYVAESVCVHQIKRYVCLALLYTEQIPPALFRLETKPRNHANGVVSLVFPRYSQVMRTPPPPPPGISSHPICTPSRGLTAHIASLINFACLFPYFVRLAIFTLSLVHTPSLYPHCRPVPLFGAALGSTWTRRRVCGIGGACGLGIYGRRATGMPRI